MTESKDQEKQSKASSKPPKRRRWGRRLLIALFTVMVFYTLFGFFGVPLLIRTVGISQLNERLLGEASLQRATFNPYTLGLVLEKLSIMDDEGRQHIAFESFDGNLQLWSTIVQRGYHFRHAQLHKPYLRVERAADGSFNLSTLWPASAEPGEPLREIPRVVVRELGVTGADVLLRDLALDEPFERALTRLDFTIPTLDTRADWENTHRLSATFEDGGSIDWEGRLFFDPLSSSGTLAIADLPLGHYMPYAAAFTDARVTDGRLTFELTYDFAPLREPRRASVALDRLKLDDVAVEFADDPVVNVPTLDITGARFDVDARRVTVEQVAVHGPSLQMVRNAQGRWRVQAVLASPATTAATSEPSSDTEAPTDRGEQHDEEYPLQKLQAAIDRLVEEALGPWDVELTRLELTDARVSVVDETRDPVTRIGVEQAHVLVGPVQLDEDHQIPFSVSLNIEHGGVMKLEGDATPGLDLIHVDIDATGLNIEQFAPYMPLARVLPDGRLDAGTMALDGAGVISRGDDGLIHTTWDGLMSLSSLSVVSLESGSPIADFDQLDINITSEAASSIESVQSLSWQGDVELKGGALDWPVAGGLIADAEQLHADVYLRMDFSDPEQPAIRLDGAASIMAGHVSLPQVNRFEAVVEETRMAGIVFDLQNRLVRFESVTLGTPTLQIDAELLPSNAPVDPDAEIVPDEGSSLTERLASYRADGSLGYLLQLGRLEVVSGTIEVSDVAAEPPVAIVLEDIGVQVSNLANDGETPMDLHVTSQVQGTGQATITGAIDPFRSASPFAEMEVEISNLPLKPYDPYAGHFLGYLIETGRLTLAAPFTLEQGQFSGRIDADLNRFHLGEKVESPAAPDAPIKLGLDLVREPDDHIRTSLDIEGDLNDPEFSIGSLVWQEFLEILLRGAVAPFRLLASVFAGDEELDLSVLEYVPGTDQFTTEAIDKIDVLGGALTERPALRLAVVGRTDAVDIEPMRAQLFDEQLLERLQASDETVRTLTAERRAEAVALSFADEFPQRVRPSVPVPPGRPDQGVPLDEMEAELLKLIVVDDSILQTLAADRARRVIDVLVAEHGLDIARVTINSGMAPRDDAAGPRTELELH